MARCPYVLLGGGARTSYECTPDVLLHISLAIFQIFVVSIYLVGCLRVSATLICGRTKFNAMCVVIRSTER